MRLSRVPWVLLLLSSMAWGEPVRGSVYDVGRVPIEGAALEVVRGTDGTVVARKKADPEGRFAFELAPGSYALRVRHPSLCEDGTKPLTVDRSGVRMPLRVELRRCVHVTGRALAVDGGPLAGVRVTLSWLQSGDPMRTVTTDARGRFELPRAPQGPVTAFLQDAGGNLLPAQLRLSAPRQLEVRARRPFQVLVRGPSGAPLPGVRVQLVPEPLDGVNQEGPTDDAGLRQVHAAPGRYRLLASWEAKDATFSRYVWRDFELKPEDTPLSLELDFAQRPSAPLSGRVRTPGGLPAAGAEVVARQLVPSVPLDGVFLRNTAYPREEATTRTDAEGRFTLPDLREGEYTLEVKHASGSGRSLASTGPGLAEVSLGSPCPAGASGRVVDEQGAPITRFRVDGGEVVDAQGRFRIQDSCAFGVHAEGLVPRSIVLPGPTPEEVTLPDIVLPRGRRLDVHLVHADGSPAEKYHFTAS